MRLGHTGPERPDRRASPPPWSAGGSIRLHHPGHPTDRLAPGPDE